MSNILELNENVRRVLGCLNPVIESASQTDWQPSNGFMPLIRRTILRRQYDCLDTISFLVEHERGYAAVPFLRAACEELIWLKYFHKLSSSDAEELVTYIIQTEIFNNLKAQDDYAGRKVTAQLNLLSYLSGATKYQPKLEAKLKALGTKLRWDKKTVENARLPSVSFLAKKAGMLPLYKFLYHASSRYVHFSGMELLRRAWGRSGDVSIRSSHFIDYWSAFSLIWGLRLFIETYLELHTHLIDDGVSDPEIDEGPLLEIFQRIGSFGQVPIITAEELAWKS